MSTNQMSEFFRNRIEVVAKFSCDTCARFGSSSGGFKKSKDAGSRHSPGARREFGSHAIRPRCSHHMQVMTVVVTTTVKFLPPWQRKLNSVRSNGLETTSFFQSLTVNDHGPQLSLGRRNLGPSALKSSPQRKLGSSVFRFIPDDFDNTE
jgi:hypothetical protein